MRKTIGFSGYNEFPNSRNIITTPLNQLLVAGNKDGEESKESEFLHVGIANRNFERRFELADFVVVKNASLEDGLLTIDLQREIPDAMKVIWQMYGDL